MNLTELVDYLEAENMVFAGQAIARSASARNASLGAHWLENGAPTKPDADSLHNVVAWLEQGSIMTDSRPVSGEV